jgi:tetratricopeptide (TPR) repeat protein
MAKNSLKNGANPEFFWVHITEAGTAAFERGRYRIAAEKWQSAYRIAQDFDDDDPRLAGSLNNMAIAFRIKNDFEKAGQYYRNALENWQSASHWIDRMRLPQRARSSLFHLRMESKHRKKYDNIARKNYRKLLAAGQAGTLNNLAELFQTSKRFKEAERFYHQALRRRISSMDEQESGVSIINMNLASLSDTFNKLPETTLRATHKSKDPDGFISKAEQQGWVVDKPSEFTDEGRLMAAFFLTYLVDHTRLNR